MKARTQNQILLRGIRQHTRNLTLEFLSQTRAGKTGRKGKYV